MNNGYNLTRLCLNTLSTAENELHDQELLIYKDSAICGDQVDFPLLRQSSEIMRTSKAKGNDLQNKEYCEKKDGDFWSSGQPTSQGQRNDLEKVVRDIGRPDLDWNGVVLENQSAYIKYHRGMRALFKVVRPQQPRNFKTQVSLYAPQAALEIRDTVCR